MIPAKTSRRTLTSFAVSALAPMIRRLVQESGQSVADLSEAVGWPADSMMLSHVMAGRVMLPIDRADALAVALGLTGSGQFNFTLWTEMARCSDLVATEVLGVSSRCGTLHLPPEITEWLAGQPAPRAA